MEAIKRAEDISLVVVCSNLQLLAISLWNLPKPREYLQPRNFADCYLCSKSLSRTYLIIIEISEL